MAPNASTSQRTGTMNIAGQTFTVTQSGEVCTYSISPTSQTLGPTTGTGSINVTAPSGCSWTATSKAPWIRITSGSSGSGNGTVSYSVAANTSTSQRTGTMNIAGQTFTVTQASAPKISASPTSVNFGNLNLDSTSEKTVTILNDGNSDLVISSIDIAGANPSDFSQTNDCTTIPDGNSCTVTVNFGPTSGGSKSGIISISSNDPKKPTINVKLSGNAKCTYSISPSSQLFDASGGTGSVSVAASSGCSWTATSKAPWIRITSGDSGSGTETVTYTVAPNTSTRGRTGRMTIVGQTFTVTQTGQ
jgi:hypothetical protein